MATPVLVLTLTLAMAGEAGFNLDFGTISGTPATGFAGAAVQPGVWQGIDQLAAGEATPLINVSGLVTDVTLASPETLGPFALDHPDTRGNAEALVDDFLNLGGGVAMRTLEFDGFAPGRYRIVTYAWAPDNASFRTSVAVPGALEAAQEVGGSWPGDLEPGVTHAEHTVITGDGRITIELTNTVGFGSLNGLQVVPLEAMACPADFDADGVVGFLDLVPLLSAWGPCFGCDEDIDHDGLVGFLDLVELLSDWGPCG